jgi:hypothetical protein
MSRKALIPAESVRGTLPWRIALLIAAFCYYALYWRSGLVLSGEEGVAAVVAERLNAGQKPIVDTFLGYNVGWFYPLSWIFRAAGPDYLLMRLYFFLLATLSGLASFSILSKILRIPWLSFLGGLIVVLLPGVIGRNAMGLLGLLGMYGIAGLFLLENRKLPSLLLRMAAAGLFIGLSWWIRIDVGFFQTVLFLLTALLFAIKPGEAAARRVLLPLSAMAFLLAGVVSINGWAIADAYRGGFGRQLTEQYLIWPRMIRDGAVQVWKQTHPPHHAPAPTASPDQKAIQAPPTISNGTASPVTTASDKPSGETAASYNDTSLKRPSLGSLLREPTWKELLFPLVIWLPLPAAILITLWGFLLVLRSVVSGSPDTWRKGGTILVTTGAALVLFPQYFFWRPDMVHLSEFMVPFMIALIVSLTFAVRSWKTSRILGRVCLSMVILAAGTDLALYVVKGWQTDGCGSIAASRRRHLEFSAPNGVRVKLNAEEFARDTLLRDLILSHSRPGEHVVCYPYFPMLNFMTERPSYEYNLYADNAIPSDLFHEQAVRNIEEHHPSVIVIGTGKVNATESSRFPNWASRTYAFIRERYDLSGTGEEIEIYTAKPLEPTKRP